MPAKFSNAPEVEEFARDIINEYYPHLIGLRVECAFREGNWANQGKIVWGKAIKVSGHSAFLASFDRRKPDRDFYLILINREVWDLLSPAQQEALVDHELAHCGVVMDEKGKLKLKLMAHDVEEFHAVLERRGFWAQELLQLLETVEKVKQMALDLPVTAD